ncbi:MAG TPA: efflux RND transporter periplasmic adaptor subunit [Vicinamibacterales bacterium]|nr:efflux RND transporter periplasmic adaptor subunit [Vicinamibacterales bacterium]
MNTTKSLIAVTALTLGACGAPAPPKTAGASAVPVLLERAAMDDVAETIESGGVVRARLTATVASRVMAPVTAVHVNTGDRVRRGAALVTLDARDLAANVTHADALLAGATESGRAAEGDIRAAEAAVRLARAGHDRVKTLHDKRSATAQELDEAIGGLSGAEARLASAQARALAAGAAREAAEAARRAAQVAATYAVLTAPFDGWIAERLVDPGSMAAPGAPLLIVEDPSALRLEVQLDEIRASYVAVRQNVEVRLDRTAGGVWMPARVAEVGRIDPASHNFLVKVELSPSPSVRSGAFGRVRFAGPRRRAVTVPDASLIRRGQLTFVFAVGPDGLARLRPVLIAATAHGRTEVLAGVSEGDALVVNPPMSLTDGARVVDQRR